MKKLDDPCQGWLGAVINFSICLLAELIILITNAIYDPVSLTHLPMIAVEIVTVGTVAAIVIAGIKMRRAKTIVTSGKEII